MFKKYYISLFSSIFLIVYLFYFSKNSLNEYCYPIKSNYIITSHFGGRELYGKYNFHNGVDFAVAENTPVYSIQSGIVSYIGFDPYGYGNYIIILHTNSYKSIYSHLADTYLVNIGNKVNTGEMIGYVGPRILPNGKSNGNTTGPHLHLSVYTNESVCIDPLTLNLQKIK